MGAAGMGGMASTKFRPARSGGQDVELSFDLEAQCKQAIVKITDSL